MLDSKHWDLSALSHARMLKTMRGPNVLASYAPKKLGPLSTFACQDAQNHEKSQRFGFLNHQNVGTSQHFRMPGCSKP